MTKTPTVHAQQKWEYMEITRKTETYLTKDLNDLGQHAWELIQVIYAKDRKGEMAWTAFLKRPFAGHAHGDAAHAGAAQPAAAHDAASQGATAHDGAARAPAADPQGFDLSGDEFKLKEAEVDPESAADKAQGKST